MLRSARDTRLFSAYGVKPAGDEPLMHESMDKASNRVIVIGAGPVGYACRSHWRRRASRSV